MKNLCASEKMMRGAEAECEVCKRNLGRYSKVYGIYICKDCLKKIVDRRIKKNIREINPFKEKNKEIKLIYIKTPLCLRASEIFENIYKKYEKRFNLKLEKIEIDSIEDLYDFEEGIFAIPNEISFVLTFSKKILNGKNVCKDISEYEYLQFEEFDKYEKVLNLARSEFNKKILELLLEAIKKNPSYARTCGRIYWKLSELLTQ